MYYKEREDLEHLGWIDLSCTVVMKTAPEVEEPFSFVLNSTEPEERRYVMRAAKAEHYNLWVETLQRVSGRFKTEKEVSSFARAFRQRSRADLHASDGGERPKSPRKSGRSSHNEDGEAVSNGNINGDDSESGEEIEELEYEEHGSHSQALKEVEAVLEKVKGQEAILNVLMKRVEKFKQKAFALEELLVFDRDRLLEPAKKVNSLMKSYTMIERSIEQLSHDTLKQKSAGNQETEMRMKLMVQRAESQVASERKGRRELEERLFRSEVMSMKLNELLSGRDVNWIDVNRLWLDCRRAGIESADFASWIQGRIVSEKTRVIV